MHIPNARWTQKAFPGFPYPAVLPAQSAANCCTRAAVAAQTRQTAATEAACTLSEPGDAVSLHQRIELGQRLATYS